MSASADANALAPPFAAIQFAVLVILVLPGDLPTQAACPRCGWEAPKTRQTVTVRTIAELERAVAGAKPGTTILIQDGTYTLNRMLDLTQPNVVLRGRSGERARVILRGASMTEKKVGVGVSISASHVVVADLTVGYVGFHGIQVRGELGVRGAVLHNLSVVDTGQQLLKGSVGDNGQFSQENTVACSSFAYTDSAPSDYTNGVDVLGGRKWLVRDNHFRNIRGPQERNYACGPTVLFWRDCRDTVILRNTIVDCRRGIALGLSPQDAQAAGGEPYFDHRGGLVYGNLIYNLHGWGDEGLEANAAKDARIEHNTVFVQGELPWSIGVRFAGSTAVVQNNLTNKPIVERDGGRLAEKGNRVAAQRNWFVDAAGGDFRLTDASIPAVDVGVEIQPFANLKSLSVDFAGNPRLSGPKPDAGAFEYSAAAAK